MHPDVNALADLAADVLPVEEARAVEAHVIACPDCADLLADAERVRPLLLSDDVGPMPDDVWARLSGAVAEEAAARSALVGPPVPMSPVPAPEAAPWDQHWQVTQAPEWGEAAAPWTGQENGWDRSPLDPGGAAAAAAAPDGTVRDQHAVQPQVPAHDPTWDATQMWDSFDLRAGSTARRAAPDDAPVAAPAAAPAGGGAADGDETTGYTRVIRPVGDLNPSGLNPSAPGGERSAETTSTLPALGSSRVSGLRRPGRAGGPSRRDVRDSSRAENGVVTRLRKVDLGKRAPLLAAAAGVVVAVGLGGIVWTALGGGSDAGDGGQAAPPTLPPVSAPVLASGRNYTEKSLGGDADKLAKEASSSRPSVGASMAANGTQLSQPAVLARCLDALNAGDQTPLAVDIAQYQNREAAIIVLRGEDGGYEVWAVSRDCGSGDEAPLHFVVVPKA